MNTNQNPSNLLRLRAEIIRQSLPELCRKENRTPTSALRVAFHLVDGEDLEGKPPKNYTPAIKEAMKYHRFLRQAEEPDYSESARRRYQQQNERFENFLAGLKTPQRAKAKGRMYSCIVHDGRSMYGKPLCSDFP